MFDFDTDVDKKLNAPSKRKIYNMLAERAGECLETAKSVCLLGLSNWRYGEWILAEHKNVERVTIIESSQLKFMYRDLESLVKYNIIYVNDDKYVDALESLEMKFDCIIMNPPYSRNLHLKILAEAIKHLKDENSVCVNLSPVRWLQDPLAKYKKNCDLKRFEESVAKHIEDLETVTAIHAQQLFPGSIMNIDLGVYKCKKYLTSFDYMHCYDDRILCKCIEYIITHNPNIEVNKQDGWRVRMPQILGGKSGGSGDRSRFVKYLSFGKLLAFKDGKSNDGKWWYDCFMRNQYTKTTPYITNSIRFETETETKNFINQFNTSFGKYITNLLLSDVNVAPEKILWLGDATNPRTGLKGYKGEWTDADLYQFFNITPEEQKVIEETMEKYR